MKNKKSILCSIAMVLLISGCQSSPAQIENQVICKGPRPEMCTMNYLPVCGFDSNNKAKTYSNGCSACSDKNVVAYIKNECAK